MTRSGKRIFLIVGVLVVAALLSSVWITIRHAEIEVQKRIAAVEIGMTEDEVGMGGGEPSYTLGWGRSDEECMVYEFPYWWDRVLRKVAVLDRRNHFGLDFAWLSRCCLVRVQPEEGGVMRVFKLDSDSAYGRGHEVVKLKGEKSGAVKGALP